MRALLAALLILGLTGCKTLRVGFTTDYGTFSYELPELPKPTTTK
jgi:hypothetical protein